MTAKITLNQDQIKKYIPHRDPFLFVEEMRDLVPGEEAVGIYQVTGKEAFFQGHFPSRPVFPGVLMVEAMAQTAGVIGCHFSEFTDKLIFFMSIDNVKFRHPVGPGDLLEFHVKRTTMRPRVWKFKGQTYVGDKLIAEGDLTAMIMDK
ncbi:MAG: 3-hydroxyacyl-ACP dehydratase FabZ [Alphaproteobacteria bacterium]|nr:3-hydroxyacyl-ACP dehydratase FabZ [Alphaproteobacteria bacterium]MBN2779890.1 3-hydroxyacyl-ACP dehydratase FabZ [Alphaproteobacteria bacterium]